MTYIKGEIIMNSFEYELMIEIVMSAFMVEEVFYGNGEEFHEIFGDIEDIEKWCKEKGYKLVRIWLRQLNTLQGW